MPLMKYERDKAAFAAPEPESQYPCAPGVLQPVSYTHLDVYKRQGIMEPIAVWVRKNSEWAIIHRCKICGALSSNRIAADDNPMKLMSLAMKPVSSPPFPLERIEEMTRLMGGDGELKW